MLRTLGAEMAMADREQARALAGKLPGGLAVAGAMALLGRAAGGTTGFAMAFMAAALLTGKSLAALLLGCGLGLIPLEPGPIDLSLPLGAAVVLAGHLVWLGAEALARRRDGANKARNRRLARSPTPWLKGATLAGSATLLPGLLLAGGAPVASAATLASALAAVCAEPFLETALALRPGRRWITREEKAGLTLLAAMLTCGVGRWSLPAASALAAGLAALLYPSGAAAGLGLGAGLLLCGGDGAVAALPGAVGLAAQLCGGADRYLRSGVACASAVVMTLLLRLPASCLSCAVAALLPALLPESLSRRLAAWAGPETEPCDPDRVAALVRRDAVARIEALSRAFGELAEGYLGAPDTPDEQTLIARLRESLCDGCPRYAECWAGEDRGAVDFLCELAAQAVDWSSGDMSEPLFPAEVAPALLRRCRRGRLIPDRIGLPLEDFARARQAELKRGAENRLISAQFLQARQLLDGMAEALSKPVRLRGRQAARAMAALESAGLPVGSALALAGPRVELDIALADGCWNRELAAAATARLRQVFGRAYLPEGDWGRSLRFVRQPRLRAETGAVCASRQAGAPSGDSHILLELDDDRLLVLLCDGMGSGPEAARESATAVRLLARFMEAGADSALAVETVNALLLNRSPEDMFATVDMLVLDLATGTASFTKLAACPTLIARDGVLRRVQGGRLPLGILEKVQPARSRTLLVPGDTLALLSDGVWEALGPDAVAKLLMEGAPDMNALAERMLDTAREAAGPRDDMTAICLRLRAAGPQAGAPLPSL